MINFSICLSDIPENKRTKGKNGKWYANFTIVKMKETDQWEKTHTVYMEQNRLEREAKGEKIYVGKGKEVVFDKPAIQDTQDAFVIPEDESDLPY
jgi:hypothetical protein